MEPRDQQTRDHEQIANRWLDAALKQYGEAEPRTGLEGRVLASLRTGKHGLAERRNWWPGLAAVAVMLAVGVAVFLETGRHAMKNGIAKVQPPVVSHQWAPDRGLNTTLLPKTAALQRKPKPRQALRTVEAAEPRLEQFPSPQPLSEQEQMLARYVEDLPWEAKQVAQAQAALLKRDPFEFAEYGLLPNLSGKSSQVGSYSGELLCTRAQSRSYSPP
jgi:hypothetical protein